jgi:murein DD-endopeptidase MepM/ murein hydrolase activator NlpD
MIEIQIHPSDIRRKVRYYFLDKRAVVLATTGLVFLLLLVLGSMAVAPSVIRRVYKTSYLYAQRIERRNQQAELDKNVAQLVALGRELDEQRVHVEKLVAIYDLAALRGGQGGLASLKRDASSIHDLADAQQLELLLRRSAAKLETDLRLISEYEAANAEVVRHTPSILPLSGNQFVLTSPFGTRISPFTKAADFHKGLDLSAPTGTPIYATADGVVTFAGRYSLGQSVAWWRFGNVVVLNHADRFITIYGHCDTTNVHAGQMVKQGDVIGTVGSTGWSTNSHLHYEVRTDIEKLGTYEAIDPRIYILNYRWKNEENLLIHRRTSKEYRDLDPLPPAFVGKKRG